MMGKTLFGVLAAYAVLQGTVEGEPARKDILDSQKNIKPVEQIVNDPLNKQADLRDGAVVGINIYAQDSDNPQDPLVPVGYLDLNLINRANTSLQYPGTTNDTGYAVISDIPLGVGHEVVLPDKTRIGSNYPNPFNPHTTIPYELAEWAKVVMDVFNVAGQHVITLVDENKEPGAYLVQWDAKNKSGQNIAQGVYIARIITEYANGHKEMDIEKMVFLHKGAPSGRGGSPGRMYKGLNQDDIIDAEFTDITRDGDFYNLVTSNSDLTNPAIVDTTFEDIEILGDTSFTFVVQRYIPKADVDGRITTEGLDVANAGVTFVNQADTLLQYSTVTSDSGTYNILQIPAEQLYEMRLSNQDATLPQILDTLFSDIYINADTTIDKSVEKLNTPPSVANVLITPSNPSIEDTLRLVYEFFDAESDSNQSFIEWYKNNGLTGVQGELFPPDSAVAGDSIKALVIPYDGELFGESVESNTAVYPLPTTRELSGIITEFFSELPDSGAMIITSIDTAYTDASGAYSIAASFDREDISVLKPNRLESGFILYPGTIDTVISHTIAKDDSSGGIDRDLFENYILAYAGNGLGRNPLIPDSVYVSLTSESVPDTVWILGNNPDWTWNSGFQNVGQLNKLGEKINVTADSVTNGLYNIDDTVILIADSAFLDSTALLAYSNMQVVSNEEFPVDNENQYKKTLYIVPSNVILGANSTYFEDDNVTIKGHALILGNWLYGDVLGNIFNTEFCSSILGGVETPSGYGSVLDPAGGQITPHDYRIFHFVIDRGPGRMFPDYPADFNPAAARLYPAETPMDNMLGRKSNPILEVEPKETPID